MNAVLFDVGNTLLHLDYAWLAAVCRDLGRDVSADDVGRADARVRRDGWGRYGPFLETYFGAVGEAAGLPRAAAESFAEAAKAEHLRTIQGIWRCPAPEAREVLDALSASGVRLGVVSNADGRVAEQLRLAGLRDPFEVVVDSHAAGMEKPDPRIFRLALDSLRVAPFESAYVGDILDVDCAGARAAGMRGILYDRWDAHPDVADRVRNLREVLALISPDGPPTA